MDLLKISRKSEQFHQWIPAATSYPTSPLIPISPHLIHSMDPFILIQDNISRVLVAIISLICVTSFRSAHCGLVWSSPFRFYYEKKKLGVNPSLASFLFFLGVFCRERVYEIF